MIHVHTPQIKVILIKTVNRINVSNKDGSNAKNAEINLTPYLNEGSSVSVTKGVNTPNNSFSIRLGDQLVKNYGDSIYSVVEPMDVVLIYMSQVGQPQIVMRGIVTDTSLDEAVGNDGKPSRVVTITGGDYGCILRMIQIYYRKGTNVKELMSGMSGQYLKDMFGIPFVSLPAQTFVALLVTLVINKFIELIGNPELPAMLVDLSGADSEDHVYPQGMQANPEGTMWSHLQKHGNLGPFYEIVIDDGENATTLHYRKPPFKSLDTGEYIFPTGQAESFNIGVHEIISIRHSRSERDVSNYYYVRAAGGDFNTEMDVIRLSIVGDGSLLSTKNYPNTLETLYGFRAMETSTEHGSLKTQGIRGQPAAAYREGGTAHAAYMLKQIKYLQDCNVDNVVFESGSIRCNGRPDFKPGRYAEIDWENGSTASCYVTSVTHNFEPWRGYTCTLQYSRGTGFVNRTASSHPYVYGKGVYS